MASGLALLGCRLGLDPVARDVCLAVGREQLLEPEGVMKISQVLHDYFTPDARDSAYQGVVRLLHIKRATQTTDGYPARFDLLRTEAEARMPMGGFFRRHLPPDCVCGMRPYPGLMSRLFWLARRGIWGWVRRAGR